MKRASRPPQTIDGSTSKIFALVLGCFFVSGLTGLMYEVLWTRMIVKIIGSAPFAVTIVLTVFMGGLGLGSYLASRTVDRIKDPLQLIRLYGVLELIIGGYGVAFPLLLILFRPLYAAIYNQMFHHFMGYNLITFLGCFILLIIPVTCMGATLPVLSRFFITRISHVGTNVGKLYGLNTMGAATGALLCGFLLIQILGVWGALAFAVALNAMIGFFCILVSSTLKKRGMKQSEIGKPAARVKEKSAFEDNQSQLQWQHAASALIILAVSGFCAMAYEVMWTKLLGLLVGPTTYSFTIVLVTFITGLALGSLFFGWIGDRTENIMRLLLATQIAAALFALLSSQIIGNSQIFFAKLIFHFKDWFALISILKASSIFIFMLLPTLCLGAAFPLVGKITTRSLSRTGKSIGVAYAVNSVGAILGSFCAGFLLIPMIGKELGLRLVIALQLITSIGIGTFLFWKAKERWQTLTPLALTSMLVIVLLYSFPHWDRKMISIGKYHRFERAEIRDVGWLEALFSGARLFSGKMEGEIVFFGDGIGGFTTVLKTDLDILGTPGHALYCNGKAEASSRLDMDTQTLSAHVPMLLHHDPQKVLVVGLASGITAGEILHYPVEQLDIIDINEQVVEASELFRPWNGDVLSHPKVELIIQDARAHMELSNRKYDVISSEPSNPWMAGLATLFTKDFFQLVKARLKDEGIFTQFIHTYQMDWKTFAMVGRTFAEIFPNSLLLRTNPSSLGPDFLLVGFNSEKRPTERYVETHIKYARNSSNVILKNHRLLYHLILSEDLQGFFGEGPINTDARPWLEFSAPKLLHTRDLSIERTLASNIWLSPGTLSLIRKDLSDVDWQIDFVEFALSIIRPEMTFQNPVNLAVASENQLSRHLAVVKSFCEKNIVTDFSSFGDAATRRACISTQIDSVRDRLGDASDKALLNVHLGILHSEIGETGLAYGYFNNALGMEPDNPDVHFDMALFLDRQGRIPDAIKHYSKTLSLDPYHQDASNNLAWILATHEDSLIRNGERAIELAEQSCSIVKDDPYLLDTLAASYAEAGRFEEALQTARKAIAIAELSGNDDLKKDIKTRLTLYERNRPYRETASFL